MSVAAPEVTAPRVTCVPEAVSSAGDEAVALAARAGLHLDPWQQMVLRQGLGERADGRWAAFECGLVVARQNGKGAVFEARCLAGLFLFDERLIMYSAHEFKTASEMFRRIEGLVSGTPSLSRRVKAVARSKGEEGIELKSGQRLRFMARSTGSGRGFSGDCNIWDEAQHLGDGPVDAMMPTMSARRNPQLWYGCSAPDKDMAPCEQIGRVRRRALSGDADGLAYWEWSAELCTDLCPEVCDQHDDPADRAVWRRVNPGIPARISEEHVAREHASMSPKGFGRERLSVGNWPVEGGGWEVVPREVWDALLSPGRIEGAIALAIDMPPDRSYTSIGLAGRRADGRLQVEVIDHEPGSGWVVDRVKALRDRHDPCAIVIDPASPAGTLIAPLEAAGVEVVQTSAREAAYAAQGFHDACMDTADLAHLDDPILASALAAATQRPLADAWAWARRGHVVISPLVAVSLAAWGHARFADVQEDDVEPWAVFV